MKYKYHLKDSNFKRIIAFTPENKANSNYKLFILFNKVFF